MNDPTTPRDGSVLRFDDGVTIETGGDFRVVRERDGLYVVGRGMLIAVDSEAEGKSLIADLSKQQPVVRREEDR